MAAKDICVKVTFGDDIRMVSLNSEKFSQARFVALVAEKYDLPYDKEKKEVEVFHGKYSFKYTDSEGDVVTISDKSDFNIWSEMIKSYVGPNTLRLTLVDKTTADKMKKADKSDGNSPTSGWWTKKAKFEKKLRKLKMLPTKLKAGLIGELIADDLSLAPCIHEKCHHLKGKGKGKGEKGKGEKGKGKGEKGKGKGKGDPWDAHADEYGYGFGHDREAWLSAYWGYEHGGFDWSPSWWDEWYALQPSEHKFVPEEAMYPFGRGKDGSKKDKGCGKKDLMARFVSDVTVPHMSELAPGETFTKTWRVRNDSEVSWPTSVYLLCVGGDPMDGPQHPIGEPKWHKWDGTSCLPGEEVDVSVTLTAPAKSGTYEAFWRLCFSSPERGFKKFGMRLGLFISVGAPGVEELKGSEEVTYVGTEKCSPGAESSIQGAIRLWDPFARLFGEPAGDHIGKGSLKGKGKGACKGKGKGMKGHEYFPDPWPSIDEGKGGGKKVLLARFVRDVTIPPSETVNGGSQFTKTWRVRNDSSQPWPANVLILFVGGDAMDVGDTDLSAVKTQKPLLSQDSCLPGEEVDVSVVLHAPTKSGTYEAFWRLCANFPERGFKKFGMRLRVKVNVSNDGLPDSVSIAPVNEEPSTVSEYSSGAEVNDFVHVDA